jgi:cell pole-organizing protein PopZ
MTAFPSTIPESTAAEQRAHEPSMEEILASIRKIISDDQAIPLSPRHDGVAVDERAPAPVREPEVERPRAPSTPRPMSDFSGSFVSAPPMRPMRPEAPRSETPRPEAPRPSAEVREITPRPAPPTPRLVATKDEPQLVSEQVDQAVQSSFQALNAARSMSTGPALENMTRDLLRPMLKEWLDDNLPSLVERLVRAEIERVARGR